MFTYVTIYFFNLHIDKTNCFQVDFYRFMFNILNKLMKLRTNVTFSGILRDYIIGIIFKLIILVAIWFS